MHTLYYSAHWMMIEYPLLSRLSKETDAAEDDTEELERFSNVDYEDDDAILTKTHWGEDSK